MKAARGLEEAARRLRKLSDPETVRGVDPKRRPKSQARQEGGASGELAPEVDALRSLLESLEGGRFLDLGCGGGERAVAARDLGWDVTAVDESLELMPAEAGIDWVEADPRAFEAVGYECVCVAGLLHRLEPDGQRELLRRCAGTPTIVESREGDLDEGGFPHGSGVGFLVGRKSRAAAYDGSEILPVRLIFVSLGRRP